MKYLSLLALVALATGLASCRSNSKDAGDRKTTDTTPADLPSVQFEIGEPLVVSRDYNQRLAVPLTNTGDEAARVRLSAKGNKGLLADFAGPGSVAWNTDDVALEIPAGETWMLPILVHADRADPGTYEVPLKAVSFDHKQHEVASAVLKVEVAKPEVKWWTSVQPARGEIGEARLAKLLRIGNEGALVSDLTVGFEVDGKPADDRLHWKPMIQEYRFKEGENLEVTIWPRLSTSFTGLEGDLVLRGSGVEKRLPVKFALPQDKQVYVTLSRCVRCSNAEGRRCTNRPSVTYEMPPVEGTPHDHGGGFGHRPSGGGLRGGNQNGGGHPTVEDQKKDEKKFGWLGEEIGVGESDDATDGGEAGDGEVVTNDVDASSDDSSDSANSDDGGGGRLVGENLVDESLEAILDNLDSILGEDAEGRVDPESIGCLLPAPIEEEGPRLMMAAVNMSQSVSNKKGGKAHLVHNRKKTKGKERDNLNFSFGIGGKSKRLSVPMRGRVHNPVLAMPPSNPNHAVAAFVSESDDGKKKGEVISTKLQEGKKPQIERLTKIAKGSPVEAVQPVAGDEHLDLFYNQDGKLRHNRVAYPDPEKPGTWDEKVKADIEAPKPHLPWLKDGIEAGPVVKALKEPKGDYLVATREDNGIALHSAKGRELIEGNAMDVNHLDDKRVMAVRRDDGAIDVMMDGNSERLVSASPSNSAPSLLQSGEKGMRLLFNRGIPQEVPAAGSHGLDLGGNFSMDYQDGKWSEPKRELMPEAPVDMAALVTSFEVPYGKSHYKRMNVDIKMNGEAVSSIENKLPNGRYIHRVNPALLNYRVKDGGEGNNIRVDTKGMSAGHYHYTDKASLYTRHSFLQDSLVASSAEDAERLASKSDSVVRHESPDLVVASNGYQLPANVEPGATVEMPVALFNAGDVVAPKGTLTASIDGEVVAEAEYDALGSFRGTEVPIKLQVPLDWNTGESIAIEVSADVEGDADPETNKLNYFLLKDESTELMTGGDSLQRVEIGKIPAESLTEVNPGSEGIQSLALQEGVRWFRVPVQAGELGVEVEGSNAHQVKDVRVFDEDGSLLGSSGGSGQSIYVRVESGALKGEDTLLKFQWK